MEKKVVEKDLTAEKKQLHEICTCAVSSITLVTTQTTTNIRSIYVCTESVRITFVCFGACTFIDVYNYG